MKFITITTNEKNTRMRNKRGPDIQKEWSKPVTT